MAIQNVPQKHLELSISSTSIERFTTLLQSGIILPTPKGELLGIFLDNLPGFTMDYIVDRVQTIFLDGNAVDDLETPLINDNTVLAVSAAMPGLAGAIFRKNSLHAALRTKSAKKQFVEKSNNQILVTLKLFNMIAQERGVDLLKNGVHIPGSTITKFLFERPSLLGQINKISLDGKTLYPDNLLGEINQDQPINLTIVINND